MSRLRGEQGMTLVELLVAATAGVIVIMGGFLILDIATKVHRETEERTAAVARGRQAMDDMTRQLRSQLCLARDVPPIVEGTDNRVVFYASLAPEPTTANLQMQKRTLQWVPSAQDPSRGAITETVVNGTGTPPNVTFNDANATTRTIVTDVAPLGSRLFRYFAFDAPNAPAMRSLDTRPLPLADRQIAVQIEVKFDALPGAGRQNRLKSVFENKIYVRTADPTDPTRSPKCL